MAAAIEISGPTQLGRSQWGGVGRGRGRGVESRRGEVGTTTTPLNPGGKALIGDDLCGVITQGEMIDTGASVRVIGSSGSDLIVVEA